MVALARSGSNGLVPTDLLSKISKEISSPGASGSMSVSIYDTAWVSIVTRSGPNGDIWAFPQCFDYLLETQLPDGSWPRYNSQVDGILNGLAALYALAVHQQRALSMRDRTCSIEDRIEKAKQSLDSQLRQWNVRQSAHVGFEILVPNMLNCLEEHDIHFDFSDAAYLNSLYEHKIAHFKPEMLYVPHQTKLLHSLEAFIGKINFSKITHHQVGGSFLGSPSSTAAYLLSKDENGEDSGAMAFIQAALDASQCGAVPSAFPSCVFEVAWALSTLLSAGLTPDDLGQDLVQPVASWLGNVFQQQNGLLGFAPGYLADADNTAKAIHVLNCLSRNPQPDSMIAEFATPSHFRSYRLEPNASFSANCNVLLALLSFSDPRPYSKEIEVASSFLCDRWKAGTPRDRWNLSEEYSTMLLVQALVSLLHKLDTKALDSGELRHLPARAVFILTQSLGECLRAQADNGSWSESPETTSYALLTISHALRCSWSPAIREKLLSSLRAGRRYLQDLEASWTSTHYLWVEKVSYGSPILTQSYCLAAMYANSDELAWTDATKELFEQSATHLVKDLEALPSLDLLREFSSIVTPHALTEAELLRNAFQRSVREIAQL